MLATLFSVQTNSMRLLQVWQFKSGNLESAAADPKDREVVIPAQADLTGDGEQDKVLLLPGRITISSQGNAIWESPSDWDVRSALLGDLNHDGLIEVDLLVWRAYQPWPVDKFLPFGGRTAEFHDASGKSCHLILIGWKGTGFRELWAGSALARPLAEIAIADLDGDGKQELAALESDYLQPQDDPSDSLAVWSWNGFGFDLMARVSGIFTTLEVVTHPGSVDRLKTEIRPTS